MPDTPNPAPRQPMDDPQELNALEDMSALMAELDTSDSMGLSDSAVGMILNCVDETDSAIKVAQLESEMVQSLANLQKALPDEPGDEPPPPKE